MQKLKWQSEIGRESERLEESGSLRDRERECVVVREHENQGMRCDRRSQKKKDRRNSGTQRKKRESKSLRRTDRRKG